MEEVRRCSAATVLHPEHSDVAVRADDVNLDCVKPGGSAENTMKVEMAELISTDVTTASSRLSGCEPPLL